MGKHKNRIMLGAYIDKDDLFILKKMASDKDMAVSSLVRRILKGYISRYGK